MMASMIASPTLRPEASQKTHHRLQHTLLPMPPISTPAPSIVEPLFETFTCCCPATRSLISEAIVWNACSTLWASLALVSRNRMSSESARSLASSKDTTLEEERSHLFPINNLLTSPTAYLSISCIQCTTL